MPKERKKRKSPREAQRLRTLRQNKPRKQIREDARRAASMNPKKFTAESSKAANDKRWAAHRAAKAAELAAQQ